MMSVSELEESTNTLIELFRLQQSLLLKLKKLQNELKLEKLPSKTKNYSIEELTEELNVAERKLLLRQNANSNRDQISHMCLFAQEAFKSVYACDGRIDENPNRNMTLLHNNIALKMNKLKEINKQLLEKQNKYDELEIRAADTRQRLQTIEWKNRDLYALLRHAEAVSDKSNRRKKAEEENVKIAKSRRALDESLQDLKIRREIFLGLIQAAKVDWFSDEHMRDLVVSLGDSFTLEPAS